MIEIMQIPGALVANVWPLALPLLEQPIEMLRGRFFSQDVMALCQGGNMQLWLASEGEEVLAAYVTEIVIYPRRKCVRAAFAGGKPHTMEKWLDKMVDAIEAWSKEWGCDGIEALGRKGWSKVVEGEVIGICMSRDYAPKELH